MDKLPYLLFIAIFSLDYLSLDLGLIPRKLTWVPEIMSVIAGAIVVFRVRLVKIRLRYIIIFVFFLLHVLAGAVANKLQPGPMIAGIRTYFKYIPFFLLPFTMSFSEKRLQRYIKFFLVLSIIQCPIAFYQRFFQFKGVLTGDLITGTLSSAGVLSIYLIGCISILFAFFLRNKITSRTFFIILLILFLPTTINETKASLILLPLAMFVPAFYNSKDEVKKRKYLVASLIAALLFISFVPIYDYLIKPRHKFGIIDFFTTKELAVPYLYKASGEEYEKEIEKRDNALIAPNEFRETTKNIKRIDSIVIASRALSRDPALLFLGLGIGNVTASFVKGWSGEYSHYVELRSGMTALTRLLWEVGLIGVICVVIFFGFVFYDARRVSYYQNFLGALSLGWISIPVILFVCLFYNNFLVHNVIGYCFFFISGIIISAKNEYQNIETTQ